MAAPPTNTWLKLADHVLASAEVKVPLWGRTTVHRGWTTDRRTLPLHLFYFVTSHTMWGMIGDRPITIASGETIWLPPGCEHELMLPDDAPQFNVYFLRAVLPNIAGLPGQPLIGKHMWDVRTPLDALYDELRTNEAGSSLLQRSLLVEILIATLRGSQRPSQKNVLSPAQRQTLMTLAEQRVADRLTAADLAKAVDLSPDYFARVFRETFGDAPRAWIMQQRIRRAAAELVETARPIKAIAYSLGYRDLYLFSRQFRAVMGRPPRAYRRGV